MRFGWIYSRGVKKTATKSRVILAGAIVIAASLVGITVPAVIPAVAATNSHSVFVFQSQSLLLSNRTLDFVINGTTSWPAGPLICEFQITYPSANQTTAYFNSQSGTSNVTVSRGIPISLTVSAGSCQPANG
jgi:hypothetical protein